MIGPVDVTALVWTPALCLSSDRRYEGYQDIVSVSGMSGVNMVTMMATL